MDLLLLFVIFAIPALAQMGISKTYAYYKTQKNTRGLSGQEVARKILDSNNLQDVYIVETGGELTDHYDSGRKVIRLSKEIFLGETVASLSVAAHEVGHALQDQEGYSFFRIRHFIFPVVQLATNLSYFILFLGLLMQALKVVYIGLGLTAFGLVFQLVTLPVEFDASKRALEELCRLDLVCEAEEEGAKEMLHSAAMTYVAGVLSSIGQLLRLILLYGKSDDQK